MRLLLTLAAVLSISVLCGCAHMDKDYLLKERGVRVASCPTAIELTVQGQQCVTPCMLPLPEDTTVIKLAYNGKASNVPVSTTGYHGYGLNGTLMVLNPDNLGEDTDHPGSVYFLRDSEIGVADLCGAQ